MYTPAPSKRDSVINLKDPDAFARIVKIGLSKDLHLHIEIEDSDANKREVCPVDVLESEGLEDRKVWSSGLSPAHP